MTETLAPGSTVHQYGLEAGLAASQDTTGIPTEIRGLDRQTYAINELGPVALIGAELSETPLSHEVQPYRAPEDPAIMNSVFELARNAEVGLETRIEAIERYVANQEAKEDQGRPGETFDEYMARLDRITAGKEPGWSPELKYAKEVLLGLKSLRPPEDRDTDRGHSRPDDDTESRSSMPAPQEQVEDTSGTEIESKPNSNDQYGEEQEPPSATESTTEAAEYPSDEAPTEEESENGTYSGTEIIDYGTPDDQDPEEAIKYILKNPKESPTTQQVVPPPAPVSLEGFGQGGAPTNIARLPEASNQKLDKDQNQTNEKARELGSKDRELLDELILLDENYRVDPILSEQLHALQQDVEEGAFDPDRAQEMIRRAEQIAKEQENNGDEVGALRQRKFAGKLAKLSEHLSEGAIEKILNPAA